MGTDNLSGVARFREHAVRQCEFALRLASAECQRSAADAALVSAAIASEAPDSGAVTFGVWLQRQLILRQEARAGQRAAELREEIARQALVEARREKEVVDKLREARAAEDDRRTDRREAAALDDVASRMRAGRSRWTTIT